MAKTIVVVGYGPGISSAVAEKFGSSGSAVASKLWELYRARAGSRARIA
jgi:hypothetical protein